MKELQNLKGNTITRDTRIKAVIFDEENHRYFYDGRELYGVTTVISKMLGKEFPHNDTVKLATLYGSDVHKEVELYYNEGHRLSTEGAKWTVECLSDFASSFTDDYVNGIVCEVMVSDFKGTASKVDVVMHTSNGVYLFDIKTTSKFDREYCTLQLNSYRRLYEKNYGEKVLGMYVLSVKSRRLFHILEIADEKTDSIFNANIKRGTI